MALALSIVIAMASPARAGCFVTPGDSGEIATWLVAGPLPAPRTRPLRSVAQQLAVDPAGIAASSLHPRAGEPLVAGSRIRWRAAASADARLDLDVALRGQGARIAFAGLVLDLSRAADLLLFLGTDDGVAVLLDGREVYRRGALRSARDDDDLVPLALGAGRHELVLKLYVNGGRMRLYARLVDGTFSPPADLRVMLPGVDDTNCDALARAATRSEVRREIVAAGTRLHVEVSYPGGSARRESQTAREFRLIVPGAAAAVGSLLLSLPSVRILTLEATAPAGASGVARLEWATGTSAQRLREIPIDVAPTLRRTLTRAADVLGRLSEAAPPSWLPRASLTSVRYVAERLAGLVATFDQDATHLLAEAATLDDLLDALVASRDPYAGRHGAMRRAYRSDIDGSLQGYSIYVPPSYRGDRPFPLVVSLHGLNGSAHRMLAVTFGLYDEHEDRTHADRHLPSLPDAAAIIVAPYGFGNAHYRQLGERDVMAVLDEVRSAYRIDPDRTYITGLSMGGIGAAAIPLHFPDVFAAAAPLAGYHSYFVRSDTRGMRRPWETFLMEARSNASWAENGFNLPLYVVHGLRDRPTDNSRVLVDRYTALGYRVSAEWPDLGHNVWSSTYAGGRIIPYFLCFRRDPAPRHVRFRSANIRWRRSYWVEIDAPERSDGWAEIDATVDGTTLRVTTRGIAALTLTPPASLFTAGTSHIEVRIDGDLIRAAPGRTLSLRRSESGHWSEATRQVVPALGPIRDVFDRPVIVVYGTREPAERAMNERVAHAWARVRAGVRANIPVVADTDVTEAMARMHALVLVGTPRSNAYLARIHARLPIRVEGGALVLGAQRFTGAQIGATFVAQNPEVPGQAVLVITGISPLGVWRSRFLPDLLPDFVVYDGSVAPARDRVILGSHASVLAAGFFGPDGSVPAQVRDPYVVTSDE